MTPNDLYARTPEKVTHELRRFFGCYYNHLPELGDSYERHADLRPSDKRVEIRFLKDWCFDGRRTWTLATVWFDSEPVMIIQNAGREGDDHAERFITHAERFALMIDYLRTLAHQKPLRNPVGLVDPDADNDDLDAFYGYYLDGHFDHY